MAEELTAEMVEPLIEQMLQSQCGDLAFGAVAQQCVQAGYSREEVLRVLQPLWAKRFKQAPIL